MRRVSAFIARHSSCCSPAGTGGLRPASAEMRFTPALACMDRLGKRYQRRHRWRTDNRSHICGYHRARSDETLGPGLVLRSSYGLRIFLSALIARGWRTRSSSQLQISSGLTSVAAQIKIGPQSPVTPTLKGSRHSVQLEKLW